MKPLIKQSFFTALHTLFIIYCSLFIVACTNNHLKVIAQNDMKVIMWDMLRADELSNYIKDSSLSVKDKTTGLYEQVFKIHDTNKEQFYTSLKYYLSHPDLYKILNDSIKAYGGRMVEDEQKRKDKLAAIERAKMHAPFYYTGYRYEMLRDTILLNDRRWRNEWVLEGVK